MEDQSMIISDLQKQVQDLTDMVLKLIMKEQKNHKLAIEALANNEVNRRHHQALYSCFIGFIEKNYFDKNKYYREDLDEEYRNNYRIGLEASLSPNNITLSDEVKSFLQEDR